MVWASCGFINILTPTVLGFGFKVQGLRVLGLVFWV